MHRQSTPEYQIDPEIEGTFRRLRRVNQGFVELKRMTTIIGPENDHDEHEQNRYVLVPPSNIIGIANDGD